MPESSCETAMRESFACYLWHKSNCIKIATISHQWEQNAKLFWLHYGQSGQHNPGQSPPPAEHCSLWYGHWLSLPHSALQSWCLCCQQRMPVIPSVIGWISSNVIDYCLTFGLSTKYLYSSVFVVCFLLNSFTLFQVFSFPHSSIPLNSHILQQSQTR